MKFSEKWLREWVNPSIGTDELVAQITMAGLEVDGVEPVAGAFSGVVVCEIVAAEPHPNADKLQVCKVTAGDEELVQVVCGAPNARPGIKVPFARVGAVLPGDFKIKRAKLRQVESFGMLCSASELGLSEDHAGIMELPAEAPVGTDLRAFMGLDDQIIEVDLTPNRSDCLSLSGLAREVGVLNQLPVAAVAVDAVAPQIDDRFPVALEAPEACPRYAGRVVRGVDLQAQTPLWMEERLRRSGIRSIDPVVDVTNYVMIELGQPMHAFDLAQLAQGIRVRMAAAGEVLTLLDGQEVALNPDTLVIADHQRPLAMAGIMGGEQSGVSAETRDIFLESAFFAPLAVAGRARSYGLHTDSSHRFERGVDHALQVRAIERATELLIAIVGGQPGPVSVVEAEAHLPRTPRVTLRAERIRRVLALDIAPAEVQDMLERLGMQVEPCEAGWQVEVPSYRFDIAQEEDLLEEIARIYGYNRLPVRTQRAALQMQVNAETRRGLPELRRQLVARGYQEAITYSFVEPALQQAFDKEHEALALANPISADMAVMRTTLWPGLVKALQHNQNRQQARVRLFETGLRFLPGAEGELTQEPMLAGLAFGSRLPAGWSQDSAKVDFFDVKGDLESLLGIGGNLSSYRFAPGSHPALHPGQCARIEQAGALVGWLGALHPSLLSELDVAGPVYLFELTLSAVQSGSLPAFRELSRFPGSSRDLAVLVAEQLPVADVERVVRETAGEWLQSLRIFDVYQGPGVADGQKSLALNLTWQHPSRTLNDEEVNGLFEAIVAALADRLGASLRG